MAPPIKANTIPMTTVFPEASRIRVEQFYPGPLDIPVICHRCFERSCVEACPMKTIKFVTETPNQEETDGYNVNLRNEHWLKLGLVDDSRVVPPGMGGGAPKSKPAAKPKE